MGYTICKPFKTAQNWSIQKLQPRILKNAEKWVTLSASLLKLLKIKLFKRFDNLEILEKIRDLRII